MSARMQALSSGLALCASTVSVVSIVVDETRSGLGRAGTRPAGPSGCPASSKVVAKLFLLNRH